MERRVELRELLVGIEGLALLRNLYDSSEEEALARLSEVRRLLDDDAYAATEETSEAGPRAGYRVWSERYDEPGDPIIELEEPVVWSLLDELPPGRALDAGCGTGRHARHLVELGHDVMGVDLTPEMLARARVAAPTAHFLEADLCQIPAQDGAFDVVVCGLALAHLAHLDRALAELGRVVKEGGRLVVSVLHPFQAFLSWHAPFEDEHGRRRFIREHPHTHGHYLRAMQSAGLSIMACSEPTLSANGIRAKRRAFRHVPEATLAAYMGLPAVLVWCANKDQRQVPRSP